MGNTGTSQLSDYQKMQQAAQNTRRLPGNTQTVQNYVNSTPARTALAAQGITNPTMSQINASNSGYVNYVRGNLAAQRNQTPAAPTNQRTGSGGGGGRGGGGAAAAPQFNQDQLNWMAELIRSGQPSGDWQRLDLPDYQAYQPKAFDDSMYRAMQGQLDTAQQTDIGTANKATQDYLNWLGANYQNAYTNPNNTYATAGQAPGMDVMSMQRLLQAQGVDPSVMAAAQGERFGADQAFGNLWRSNAANEDIMQRNRIGAGQLTGMDAVNRINALAMGGRAGINQQQGAAKSAYDQRVEEWAREDAALQQQALQQEAMSNWQQGNTVNEQTQAYRNAAIQALLGFLPEIKGTALTMPTAQSLGWA